MVAGQREEVEIVPEMGESRFVPDLCLLEYVFVIVKHKCTRFLVVN